MQNPYSLFCLPYVPQSLLSSFLSYMYIHAMYVAEKNNKRRKIRYINIQNQTNKESGRTVIAGELNYEHWIPKSFSFFFLWDSFFYSKNIHLPCGTLISEAISGETKIVIKIEGKFSIFFLLLPYAGLLWFGYLLRVFFYVLAIKLLL